MQRSYNRHVHQLRPLRMTINSFGYADGSVLFEIGNTKVLCSVSLAGQVPKFLRGKKRWWLTASYAMLPTSTYIRFERESIAKRSDRSVEISRLIGRVLRAALDLDNQEFEKTIYVDCDVLQADGGTRTACITAAFVALNIAHSRWITSGILSKPIIRDTVVAISVGILGQTVLVDIDFSEDSIVQADFNFVFTGQGNIIEIQGTAERQSISWQQLMYMKELAYTRVKDILAFVDDQLMNANMNLIFPRLSEVHVEKSNEQNIDI